MKIVITVAGVDRVGIVYDVARACKEQNINIVDITQKVLGGTFSMVMMAECAEGADFASIVDTFEKLGSELGLVIHTMRQDIFDAMHRI